MLKRILKNQNGLGMAEVIIAGGIAVALAMGVTKITQNAQKGMTKINTDNEFNEFKNFIKSSFSRGENCRNTFNDTGAGVALNGALDLVTINDGSEATPGGVAGTTPYKAYTAAGTFIISTQTDTAGETTNQLDLIIDQSPAQLPNWIVREVRVFQIEGFTGVSGTCHLKISLDRKSGDNSKRSFGALAKVLWIPLNCNVNQTSPAALMQSCSAQDTINTGFWKLFGGTIGEGIKFEDGPVHVGQDLVVSGAIAVESDARIKKDKEVIENASEKLADINGFYYFLRRDEFPEKNYPSERQIGLIAQELEQIFPEAVGESSDGIKNVNYIMMVPVLIQAHKEQEQKIKRQEGEILYLNRKIDFLMDEVENLKK